MLVLAVLSRFLHLHSPTYNSQKTQLFMFLFLKEIVVIPNFFLYRAILMH